MWNPQTDNNLQNAWHRQYRKSWSRPQNERRSRIFHIITWKIFDTNIKSYMHFKEESMFYLRSKFHPDRCKFSVIIWLSKFTSDFWSRLPTFTSGFYNHPPVPTSLKKRTEHNFKIITEQNFNIRIRIFTGDTSNVIHSQGPVIWG